jgi:hypothetical protein
MNEYNLDGWTSDDLAGPSDLSALSKLNAGVSKNGRQVKGSNKAKPNGAVTAKKKSKLRN